MTQRKRSQSIGLLMIAVSSAMLLWALTAVVWPVPVVYADDPEIITITVTSSLETYFYDPGLDPTGDTVYFNNLAGEGAGQVLTVTVTCSGTVTTFEGAPAFWDNPPSDISAPWQVTYTVEAGVGTQSGIVFTVTNAFGQTDTAVITFTQDNTDPTIISPILKETSSFLHTPDGFTLYYGDDMATAAVFWVEGDAEDDESGPKLATYSEAFGSTPSPDPLNPPSYHYWGEAYYTPDKKDWGNGTITVTVYDQVSNSTIQVFTYTRDIISPTIVPTAISETSSYLYADDLTLYYSDRMGDSKQKFEVQGTASDNAGGAGFQHVIFSNAFGDSLEPVTTTLWSGIYDVVSSNNGNSNIIVTAYDNVSNWSTGVFTYIEDTTNPTVTLTYITPPGYDVDDPDDYFDADGSNWYNADDFIGGNWVFTSTTADDGADLASGSAFWDHSADQTDRTLNCGPGGDGIFSSVSSDANGTVTVTVTITDHVGNLASDTVVFNLDNTAPTLTLPYINDYGNEYLHADGLTIYYGNGMGSAQTFTVNGHSSDNGGVGLNVTDTVDFSTALWDNPSNSGTQEDWSGEYSASSGNTTSGQIIVTVYDLLNNPATQIFTYTRDIENPASVASSPQYDNGSPIVVTYTNATDTGGSGLQRVRLWYKKEIGGTWTDSGLAQTGTSGSFNFTPTGGDGTYYFATRAEDNVGNQEDIPTGSGDDEACYDTIAPSVPGNFADQPDGDSGGDGFLPEAGYYDDTTIDLEWDPSIDYGSDLLTYHLGTAPQPTVGSYAEDSSYDVGSGGIYTLYLTAEDNAGNISNDAVTGPVVVDTQAPQGSVDCPDSTTNLSFVVSWSATDQGLAGLRSTDPYSVSYKVDDGKWQDWITATSDLKATFGPDSPVTVEYSHTYCFRMRAVDKAGNVQYTDGNNCTETYPPGIQKVFLPIVLVPDPNWDFERGDFTNWQHGGELARSVSSMEHRCGNYSALLGKPSYNCSWGVPVGSAWLRRSVMVPSGGSATLSFSYRIFTNDKTTPECFDKFDLFAVYINGSQLHADANITYPATCNTTYDLGWNDVSFPLDAYEGQTIEIAFYNYNRPDTWSNTYTYVDCVSVQ